VTGHERKDAADVTLIRQAHQVVSHGHVIVDPRDIIGETKMLQRKEFIGVVRVSGTNFLGLPAVYQLVVKNHILAALRVGAHALLAGGGALALIVPVASVLMNAQSVRAQSPDAGDWQAAAGGKKSFDVASVKPSMLPREPNFPLDSRGAYAPGGRLSASFPLWFYVSFAYKLPSTTQERGRCCPFARMG
jgi:hypothetical protein